MSEKVLKRLHFYYIFVLSLIFLTSGVGLFFYWNQISSGSSKTLGIMEASSSLEKLNKKNLLPEVHQLVSSDKGRDAKRVLEEFEKNLIIINKNKEVQSFEDLDKEIISSKKKLDSLIAFPEIKSIINVLNSKVSDFEAFVIINKWKTLTRLSKRLLVQLEYQIKNLNTYFQYQRLEKITQLTEKYLDSMKDITLKSVLAQTDKDLITSKISNIFNEVEMIKKYISLLKSFLSEMEQLSKNYKSWTKEISPEMALEKMALEQKEKSITLTLVGFVFGIFFFLFLSFLVFKFFMKSLKKAKETEALNLIKNSLIPFEFQLNQNHSDHFSQEIRKYHEYIHKRISFGTIFQEGLPFASLLLDSNLNLIWANNNFYNQWNIEESSSSQKYNWEYLQRFTNLGEHDPIVDALQKNLAGIFQIQIQKNQSQESCPYEMYVSPISYNDQLRIMIIFYPLTSLQDTITNQTKSLVGPVKRSLDALNEDIFDEDFQDKIKSDFDIAGISEVFDKFCSFAKTHDEQKRNFMGDIERLEGEIFDLYKVNDSIRDLVVELNAQRKQVNNDFIHVKDSIITLAEKRGFMEENILNLLNLCKVILKSESFLISNNYSLKGLISSAKDVLDKISPLRPELKSLNAKISHTKNVSENVSKLSSLLTSFDVGLSKLELIISDCNEKLSKNMEEDHSRNKLEIENGIALVKDILKESEVSDNDAVLSIKTLYQDLRECDKTQLSLDGLVDQKQILLDNKESDFNNYQQIQ